MGFDGCIKRVNPALEILTGFTHDEILTVPFIDLVHPDDRPAAMSDVEKLAAGGVTRSIEFRIVCKDGSNTANSPSGACSSHGGVDTAATWAALKARGVSPGKMGHRTSSDTSSGKSSPSKSGMSSDTSSSKAGMSSDTSSSSTNRSSP